MVIRLATSRAPLSAHDFLRYVDAGCYDGGAFDRLVRPDNDNGSPVVSVVQGCVAPGAVLSAGVPHEPTTDTGLRHVGGAVSLPRLGLGTGSGARFFVCVGDAPALDAGGRRQLDGAGFAVFGHVVAGMDVVREIHGQPCTAEADHAYVRGQVPVRPVRIQRAQRVG